MEIINLISLFISSITTTTCIVLMLVIALSWIKLGKRSEVIKSPPGPWKLPIIGSLHHLATGSFPHCTLDKLAKRYGPVMHLKLGQVSTIVVSSPTLAQLVMTTNDLALADRATTQAISILSYNLADLAFAPYGDHWKHIKKICVTQLLSIKKVKSFQCIREQEVTELISTIRTSAGTPLNLKSRLTPFSRSILGRATIGEKLYGQDSLVDLAHEALKYMSGFNFTDFFPSLTILDTVSGFKSKLLAIHEKRDQSLEEVIKKRRDHYQYNCKGEEEDESLLDVLLKLQTESEDGFSITDETIKAVILDMFAAGSDNVATTIEWAMTEMIRNPRVMRKVQSELRDTDCRSDYLKLVIKETLRLHPAGPLLSRDCREPCEIYGYVIPVKTRVIVNAWSISRDPTFWIDAESFIPERFEKCEIEFNRTNFNYLPFGGGRRICPGISLGLSVVELTLAQLLYHFDWKLPNSLKPEDLDMSETFGLAAGKKSPLYLIPNTYSKESASS